MIKLVAGVAAALLQAGGAPPQGAWILTCDAPSAGAAQQQRVFRLAPRLLQEWVPATKSFGPNLCDVFVCRADSGRLEGTVISSSLTLTITADPTARRATWRTQGASNLARTDGACDMEPDKPAARPTAP